ncbi:non-ribosomal peptide synthetase [Actinocrispum wychmicini]|uniref:Amino acid adenylation domain-containing protein n=1 Tax=Actinocrispum wychmicini TaxID=1213861 RepID=A0A4R2JFS3_9PSEU|nr:non-ribosomal peptide synthetase [Actinocrispum wychmicini]TCO55756.1 amino acid adenylation domain-containing protein [Actinocrispum wychmicini]
MFPLSYAQQRLWFIHRVEGPSATYNVPLFLRLDGLLDVPALGAAVDDVVARHESLRVVLGESDGTPFQRVVPVADAAGLVLTVVDTPLDRLDVALHEVARRPFDLEADLPIRAQLLRLGTDAHVLALVLHHVVCDGWSVALLLRDLGEAYAARLDGREPAWPPLPVQYSDYTLWQRELLDDGPDSLAGRQIRFWRDTLAGLPDELALPFDRTRPPTASHRGAVLDAELSPELHAQLADLARRTGCTLFMALQAAVAMLLTRCGAGEDVPFGVPVAGRADDALNDLVGFFVNTVVLRADTSGNPTFEELLRRVRAADLDAYAHQDIPFERLVEVLNPDRSAARHPLFQVMIAANETRQGDGLRLAGIRTTVLRQTTDTAKFDLSVDFEIRSHADGTPAGVGLAFEYATDLFDEQTVRELAERLLRLVTSVAEDPTCRIRDIPILSTEERDRLLVTWNGPVKREVLVDPAAEVRRWAALRPDAVAVSDGRIRYTYRELAEAIDRVAGALAAAGAGPDDLTAIHADRSAWFVATAFGVLGAGSGYLALDRTLPAERIRHMLADSGAGYLVVSPDVEPVTTDVPVVDLTGGRTVPEPAIGMESLAYAVFTSGSTGRPKGVLIPHRGLSNHLLAVIDLYGLTEQDTMAFNAPLTFDVSVWQALTMPVAGGRVHVLDDDTTRDPLALAGCVDAEGVTVLQIVPQVLRAVLDMWDVDDGSVALFKSLRWMLVHGEELPPDLVDRWFARHPDVPLVNVYGPAECSDDVSISFIDAADDFRRTRAPIGRLLRNTKAYVLDDYLQLVPVGVVGELYVGGVGLARGYAGRPDVTAQRFVANPLGEPGERMYRTGDLVRWNSLGELEFIGRADHQVKIRGFRIEPGEVRAAVERDPAVRQAFVLPREDQPGNRVLVAYVVPAEGAELDVTAVRRGVAEALPEYMVPAFFVRLDELPVTPNGKLDRKALPAPEIPATSGQAPRTPHEALLCALFAEVLGVPEVGVADSFFELGGHSMLAMRLLSRARALLGLEITIRTLFDTPTVAGILSAIDSGSGTSSDVLLSLGGHGEPLFCVHPATGLAWSYAGLLPHLPAGTALYGLQAPGLGAGEEIPADVDRMLDRVLTEIRRVRPAGPYRLLGWSLGGNIAHALAERLQAAGDKVALLALVDSFPGEVWPYPPGVTPEQWDEFSLLSSLVPVASVPDDLPAALPGLRRAAREVLGLDAATFRRLVAVGVNSSRLVAGHRPAPVRGRVLYFAATHSRGPNRPEPSAWESYVDELVIHDLPCRHEEAMDAEFRARIAAVITAELTERR